MCLTFSSSGIIYRWRYYGRLTCGIWQELLKMFNDSKSFYYCHGADLTNTTQRRHRQIDGGDDSDSIGADDRFFWNKHMLLELINSDVRKFLKLNLVQRWADFLPAFFLVPSSRQAGDTPDFLISSP